MPRAQRRLHVRKLESRQAEPPCYAGEYSAGWGRNTVAGQRRAQLQIHERAQQIVTQAAGLAQPLDAELGVVARGLARPEAGDRRADIRRPEIQLLPHPPRPIAFSPGYTAIGSGDATP